MAKIKIGKKEYVYRFSVNVSEAFEVEHERLVAEGKNSTAEFNKLIVSCLYYAILDNFYSTSWVNRIFNGALAKAKTPSTNVLYHYLDINDIIGIVADMKGVSPEDIKKGLQSDKKKVAKSQ